MPHMDIYRPDQWHDLFIMVGGGTAALTGLVFVAMSLNLDAIVHDATHRYRAIGTLSSFTAVFILSSLVLMGGQNHVAVGIEWLTVSGIAAYIYINGYIQAHTRGGSREALSILRTVIGTTCYLAQIVGSIILIMGHLWGLYLASVAMIAFFAYMISGAWLLVVGVQRKS